MTARYGSFDTHIAMVYDILCNMVCIIECHKMAFLVILWPIPYDIECQNHSNSNRVIQRATSSRQIKLWIQNQQLSQFLSIFRRKMLNLKRTYFPLYFLAIFCQSLCKFDSKSTQEDDLRIQRKYGTCFYVPHCKRIPSGHLATTRGPVSVRSWFKPFISLDI